MRASADARAVPQRYQPGSGYPPGVFVGAIGWQCAESVGRRRAGGRGVAATLRAATFHPAMLLSCSSCHSTNRVPAARLLEGPKCGQCKAPITVQAPVDVDSDADFQELVGESPLPVLVDFWAPWCGPCRMVAPVLEQLARERAGALVIGKVNTDALPKVAAQFGIQSIPTMVLFRAGREAHRESGAMPAPAIVKRFSL